MGGGCIRPFVYLNNWSLGLWVDWWWVECYGNMETYMSQCSSSWQSRFHSLFANVSLVLFFKWIQYYRRMRTRQSWQIILRYLRITIVALHLFYVVRKSVSFVDLFHCNYFCCCLSHWATQIVSSSFLFVVVWLSTCWLNHCACMDVSRLHLQQLVNLPLGTA